MPKKAVLTRSLSKTARISAQLSSLPGDALLTPADLMLAGIADTTTLNNWRSKCVGPKYLRVGSGVRYRLADVREWLADGGTLGPLHRWRKKAA